MWRLFLIPLVMGCAVKKAEVREDWHDYLSSKGVHDSICVQGLINRLEEWDCEKVDVEKFNDRVEVECFRRQKNDRETYWERHKFVVREPVFTKNKLNFNLYRHPTAICIDTVRAVDAYEVQKPKKERIKMK